MTGPESGDWPDPTVAHNARRPGSGQLSPGDVLNQAWRVGTLIGRGGMSEVYRGENLHSGDPVAIKVLLPHLTHDPATKRLLLSEARKMNKVRHPAIIHYVMIGEETALGVEYIVMDLVEGPNLGALIGPAPAGPREWFAFARRLAEGLAAAHRAGVFMRDLSPDNILAPHGRLAEAVIIDFGIARDNDPSHSTIIGDAFAGKLGFVAPEQFGEYGGKVGPWTDIYSLGLILAATARGRVLDMGVTLADAVMRRRQPVDLADQPAPLQPLLASMLVADPARRLQNMEAFLDALDQTQAAAGLAAPPPTSQAYRPPERPPGADEETGVLMTRHRAAPARQPRGVARPALWIIGGVTLAAAVFVAALVAGHRPTSASSEPANAPAPTTVAAPPSQSEAAPPAAPAALPAAPVDPAAGLIGSWAVAGLGCSSPVVFSEFAGGLTQSFAGATVNMRPAASPASGALVFLADDGARYVLIGDGLSMIPAGSRKPMTLTRCGG